MTFTPTSLYTLFWTAVLLIYMAFWNAMYDYKFGIELTRGFFLLGVVLILLVLHKQLNGG